LEEVHYETTVPTIRDRVVQTAAKLLMEPIFEADLEPNAYGYRPKRSAQGAIREVHKLLCEGYTTHEAVARCEGYSHYYTNNTKTNSRTVGRKQEHPLSRDC
jgi:hypothetical protein